MKHPENSPSARPLRAGWFVAMAVAACGLAGAQTTPPAPNFSIARFAVDGNSLLPAAEIGALMQTFAGPQRDFSDVQRAVEALQAAYRRAGYGVVLVQLPEQELAQGVVRIKVIEPRLRRVTVEGNQRFSPANIRASLPGLREGATPNTRDVSASLKVANTNPAKQTALALESPGEIDGIDATVRVTETKPWRIGLNADNTGTPDTGRTRLGLLYQHANVLDLDHVASLQYTTSAEHPSRVNVIGGGYHVPLYALGDSLDFFASHSDVDSGRVTAGVLDLQVSGKGTVLGARYNHTLAARGDWTSTLTFGADWRAYRNSVGLQGFDLGSDVTVHPLSLAYAGQLALPSAVLGVQLTGVFNIPGGENGGKDAFERQRLGASTHYRLLRYGAGYSHGFEGDWQLRLQFNGQATRDALVPGEQFGAGGAGSVRGFQEREVAGDQGQFAGAELQTPNWCPTTGAVVVQCRAVAFVEGARVTRNKALPGEEQRTGIASAGVGLRFAIDRRASLQIDFGRVIDGGGMRQSGDSRVHVALALSY